MSNIIALKLRYQLQKFKSPKNLVKVLVVTTKRLLNYFYKSYVLLLHGAKDKNKKYWRAIMKYQTYNIELIEMW